MFGKKKDELDKLVEEFSINQSAERIRSMVDGGDGFIVRVGFSPRFIDQQRQMGNQPTQVFIKALGSLVECELKVGFTFVVFSACEPEEEQCRAAIYKACSSVFPGQEGNLSVCVAEKRNSELASLMETIYTYYSGWDSYLEVCSDLFRVVPVYRERKAIPSLMNMNFLVACDSGCGFSTMVRSMSDFASKTGIVSKDKTKCYEFCYGEKTEDGKQSQDDIIATLTEGKTECNFAGIDFTYFLDERKNEEMRDFLRRLMEYQQDYIFLFRIPYLEKKNYDVFLKKMSDMLLIREIIIPPIHDRYLFEAFCMDIEENGFTTDSEAVYNLFRRRLALERKDGREYGFRTVRKIADECIYAKIKNDLKNHVIYQSGQVRKMDIYDIQGIVSSEDETEKDGFSDLENLVGMEKVIERIREIVTQVKLAMKNEKMDRPCIHMRFVGAPGTGKTTVARAVGKIFRENGILSKGGFFEHNARSLCGEYVGQTAPRTFQVCREAYGSVLFLDEAYSLYHRGESGNDFGREALSTLISEMENHRDDMIVIMAGYTDEMDELMEGNTGLRSRMPYLVEFRSYTREELYQIFIGMAKKAFSFSKDFEEEVKKYFEGLSEEYINSREFANARFVRNLYERTWSKAALRCSMNGDRQISLSADDFRLAASEKEFSEKIVQKAKSIGF